MPKQKSKITLEPVGRDMEAKWTDPATPMPLRYRVIGLVNCITPQIGSLLKADDVHKLLDARDSDVSIRAAKDR